MIYETHLLKQSQSVIAQIERDYYRDILKDENQLSKEAKALWNNSKIIAVEVLSNSIRIMYFLCMGISLLGIGYALCKAGIINI